MSKIVQKWCKHQEVWLSNLHAGSEPICKYLYKYILLDFHLCCYLRALSEHRNNILHLLIQNIHFFIRFHPPPSSSLHPAPQFCRGYEKNLEKKNLWSYLCISCPIQVSLVLSMYLLSYISCPIYVSLVLFIYFLSYVFITGSNYAYLVLSI